MNDKKHITKEQFILFQQDLMNQNEMQEFLMHVASCDYCADQFSSLMSEDIIPAPRTMKENILAATKKPEIQLAKKMNESSRKIKLLWYSLKVGTATVCALLLLLLSFNLPNNPDKIKIPGVATTAGINQSDKNEPITISLRNGMDHISKSILNFSNQIMKMEVSNHDQQEK